MADSLKPGSPQKPSQSTRKNPLSRIGDALFWIAICGVLYLALYPKDSGPHLGEPAASLELVMVEGGAQRLVPGELERPLLIEAFASWCGACRRNVGVLSDLKTAQKEGILDVVAVSVDDSEKKALAAKRSWPIPVDVLFDESGSFARNYRVDVLPTYILIGTDGRVKRVTTGNPGASDFRAWLSESSR